MRHLKEYIVLLFVTVFTCSLIGFILVKDLKEIGLIITIAIFTVLYPAVIILFKYLEGDFDPIQKALNIKAEKEMKEYKKKILKQIKDKK